MVDLLAMGLQLLGLAGLIVTVQARAVNRDRKGRSLHDAASRGDVAGVRELLATGVSPNALDEDGVSALMAAAFSGEVEAVRFLLEAGADTDLQDESGFTALMNAVIGEGEMDLDGSHPVYLELVEALIAAGADIDLEDEAGMTAEDYAHSYDLVETAELLQGG